MRSPRTIGDEWPGGSAVFQRTFLSGPICVGNLPAPTATPELGPRNCDHSAGSAARSGSPDNSNARAEVWRSMRYVSWKRRASLAGYGLSGDVASGQRLGFKIGH